MADDKGDRPDFLGLGLTDRDLALVALSERDFEAQLIAIREVLKRNRHAEQKVAEDIQKLDAQVRAYAGDDDRYQQYLEGHWIDAIHASVYEDAAHGMSAVGMLAPYMESLFVSLFDGLRRETGEADLVEDDASDLRTKAVQKEYWDPHFVFDKTGGRRKHLAEGVVQLAQSVGVMRYWPKETGAVTTALFVYRNRMFHQGFEWPMEERLKFERQIVQEKWPATWFSQSMSGGKPWIFYMSEDYIKLCLSTIDRVIEGTGAFLREKARQ